jgi:hypothetical protein
LCTFSYNGTGGSGGAPQAFIVPAGITAVTIDAWGAQGGDAPSSEGGIGGLGGHARGIVSVAPGSALRVRVGGQPFGSAGGYNGGGGSGGSLGGGGASDVRIGGDGLDARVVVAGGGGAKGLVEFLTNGEQTYPLAGGAGGGVAGGDGPCDYSTPNGTAHATGCGGGGTSAAGGTVTASAVSCPGTVSATDPKPGTAGQGGAGGRVTCDIARVDFHADVPGGGGGGGWFGGGGGTANLQIQPFLAALGAAGGGGSGYVAPAAFGAVNEAGVRAGNGLVTIAYVRTPPDKEACRHGGWRNYVDDAGKPFPDQAACVAWVEQHSKK